MLSYSIYLLFVAELCRDCEEDCHSPEAQKRTEMQKDVRDGQQQQKPTKLQMDWV